MRQQVIAVRDTPVVFREAGTGPAVLLAPGLGLSGGFYKHSYGAFADAGLRLIVPDLPGFGGTPAVEEVRDVDSAASFLIEFANTLGITDAAWLGHSLGAQVCLAAAATRPDRARAVVLVGPTGLARTGRLSRQVLGLSWEAARAPWRVVRPVLRDYVRTSPARYLRLWRHGAEDHPQERAATVRCPCLVVVGSRDRVVSRPGITSLCERLDDCAVAHVRGAGHGLPREDPAGFHAVVIPFLRRAAGHA